MGFLITTLILFAFTLIVPGLASQTDEERLEKALELARAQRQIAEENLDLAAGTEELEKATIKLTEAKIKQLDISIKLAQQKGADIEALKLFLKLQQEQKEDLNRLNEVQKDNADRELKRQEAIKRSRDEAKKKLEELEKAHKDYAESFQKDLSNMVGMQAKFEDTLLGGFAKFIGGADSFGAALKELGKNFNALDLPQGLPPLLLVNLLKRQHSSLVLKIKLFLLL